jgi:hypothetical protein
MSPKRHGHTADGHGIECAVAHYHTVTKRRTTHRHATDGDSLEAAYLEAARTATARRRPASMFGSAFVKQVTAGEERLAAGEQSGTSTGIAAPSMFSK